jgi:GST-like protein
MIDFHYWPTPNGWKVAIMLEECGLPYTTHFVNIGAGDQFSTEFLALSPNGRMPAIVDHQPAAGYPGQPPVSVFESAAILWYLAEKTGLFLPSDALGRKEAMEWLFWQMANLGPMAGQLSHFVNYVEAGDQSYARQRYANEVNRCLTVLEQRLAGRDYILGDHYSIADMAAWPWVLVAKPLGQVFDHLPNVSRWRQSLKARPAVRAGVDLGKESRPSEPLSDDARRVLFNQGAGPPGRR